MSGEVSRSRDPVLPLQPHPLSTYDVVGGCESEAGGGQCDRNHWSDLWEANGLPRHIPQQQLAIII